MINDRYHTYDSVALDVNLASTKIRLYPAGQL